MAGDRVVTAIELGENTEYKHYHIGTPDGASGL